MLMTEDEARTKWCPMARIATNIYPHASAINRGHDSGVPQIPPGCQCIASKCAMWQWHWQSYDIPRGASVPDGWRIKEAITSTAGNEYNRLVPVSAPLGYCGLADEPED